MKKAFFWLVVVLCGAGLFFSGDLFFSFSSWAEPAVSSSVKKHSIHKKKKKKKKKRQKRKRAFRKRKGPLPKAEGSRAPSRFEPQTFVKSIYRRYGRRLPVDPD